MKLSSIHRTHPEIFCELSLEQQEELLMADSYIVLLQNPLRNWKISASAAIERVHSFSGFSGTYSTRQTRTLIYWNDSQSIYIELL